MVVFSIIVSFVSHLIVLKAERYFSLVTSAPYDEKYPNLEASWGMERRTFGSVYDILASSISPPWQKISKFAEISGHGKGQLLAKHTMFLRLHYHPHGEKYPNMLKSWGTERVNFWISL